MAKIHMDHISRVEGHGALTVELDGNTVRDVKLNYFEGMRGFESLVLGRPYQEIPPIISRICAICSAGHSITAHMSVEKAMGIKVTPQTELLRELAFLGMMVESHSLHVFCLVLPDFFGYAGVADMAAKYEEEIALGLRVKKAGNLVQEAIGGRAIHNVNLTVGGLGKLPTLPQLKELRQELQKSLVEMEAVVDLVAGLTIPEYEGEPILFKAVRPTTDCYGFFGDTVLFSDGQEFPADQYTASFQETESEYSNAKPSTRDGEAFMVGALARINLFGDRLTGKAQEALAKLAIPVPSTNPLYNSVAQVVEIIYALERSIAICDHFLEEGIKPEGPVEYKVQAGTGIVATEVPRGTLYHAFSFDNNGRVTAADVITPTALNQASVEKEIALLAKSQIDIGEEQLKFRFEQLVRAYDPCISCSVHLIRLA